MTCVGYDHNIYYGEVQIRNVLVNSIGNEIVYDPHGVDPIGVKTVVECTGDVHTESSLWTHGHEVPLTGGDHTGLAPGLRETIRQICKPRQEFQMYIGGELFLSVAPSATEWCNTSATGDGSFYEEDIAHGPKASCTVQAVKGKVSARCSFRFEMVTKVDCQENKEFIDGVLSLRWFIIDNIDCSDWTTTRQFIGTIRVKNRDINPHGIGRLFTIPPLQKGFQRKSIQWEESSDGLTLNFAITDKEKWAMAPSPATDWRGTYEVKFDQRGLQAHQILNFTLVGSKDTDKRHLLKLGARIIGYKLRWDEVRKGDKNLLTSIIESYSISEPLDKNAVTFNVHMWTANVHGWLDTQVDPKIGKIFELGMPLNKEVSNYADNPRGASQYDKEVATMPPGGPTADFAYNFLCELANPCCTQYLSGKENEPDGQADEIIEVDGDKVEFIAALEEDIPSVDRLRDNHKKSMYSYYQMTSQLHTDRGWRGFPIAKQCVSGEASVAFAKIHCPMAIREVKIHACRLNSWPEVPALENWTARDGTLHVLAWHKIEPCPVRLTADGWDKYHEIYATYWYYLDRVPDLEKDGVSVGVLPYIQPTEMFKPLASGQNVEFVDGPKDLLLDGSYIHNNFFCSPETILDRVDET